MKLTSFGSFFIIDKLDNLNESKSWFLLRSAFIIALSTLLMHTAKAQTFVTATKMYQSWNTQIYSTAEEAADTSAVWYCNSQDQSPCYYGGFVGYTDLGYYFTIMVKDYYSDNILTISPNLGGYVDICPPNSVKYLGGPDPHACLVTTPTASVQIVASTPVLIPNSTSVLSGKILAHEELTIKVSQNNSPASGANIVVQSNRPSDVLIGSHAITDSAGTARAAIETRDQTSASAITANSSPASGSGQTSVTWLPAHYENKFLITCYVISNENDFVTSAEVSGVSGLPRASKYRKEFISDVRLQGSGLAADGSILHYDGDGRYSLQSCARTAKNVCAVDGSTIAVDRKIIPMLGTVAIDTVGKRIAQDTGGAILGNHIDVYYGARRAECRLAGQRHLAVDFIKY